LEFWDVLFRKLKNHSEQALDFTGLTLWYAFYIPIYGGISLAEIIKYVENKTGTNAIISETGEQAPFNGFPNYGLNLEEAERLGYKFPNLTAPLYNLLDRYIEIASNEEIV